MQDKYAMRRSELTRKQSAMVRAMLNEKLATMKNHIVSMVDCGNDEYGNSGISGYEWARKTVVELKAHQELCLVFPPDDMWND